MQLTESWKTAIPQSVQKRYDICETRNAAGVMQMGTPEAFADMVVVLDKFELTVDKLTTPGGNKSVVAKELDEAFRVKGFREARFDQTLTTRLTVFRWTSSPDPSEKQHVLETTAEYGGHKVDNVRGRAALDVEWNPKDGNLDRDLGNYVTLYEAGVIDMGVIVTRVGDELRHLVRNLISQVKAVEVPNNPLWKERMRKLANDPFGTSTTSNFGKLVPRLERGDGRGCPILAIAITERCLVMPSDSIEDEVKRLAAVAKPVPEDCSEDGED
ncbi:BglII/BstYI family type II restriction endonuclease [Mycobacteroides abscessus]|uniref:BglII/BstYI family type II restriction endonuclease n=1 Tax=Mycobacteroides abscessus TaxID=36809 RepID=UPI00092BA3BD|nr:BglII/BstYI family type II restriction endonuclease [Mycobacteroides abscessus]SIE96333.1 Restriction endonuclease BglII [Mycobacteroides abscessus subsp. abscessus]